MWVACHKQIEELLKDIALEEVAKLPFFHIPLLTVSAESLEKTGDIHLAVAAFIATVAFVATITVPSDFKGRNRSTKMGPQEPEENISHMDASLYKAAAEGNIEVFNNKQGLQLESLKTPNHDNVLHVNLATQETTAWLLKGLWLNSTLFLKD
ncbi:hypothetical protein Gogos_022312 [Gossypium gossypioides]|uniref:PGG domain-containing protein n=1 Tax=Gossypium gossypioides TaxID=34282 RepID=A0A7J9D1F9_GOSGO|nr:hypothetical protein [Gossypium gossypioides]